MEESTFKAIIEVEQEIQSMVGLERERVASWSARAKVGIEREIVQRRQQLKEAMTRERDKARRTAEESAAQLLRETRRRVTYLDNLDDTSLKRIVWRHMAGIVPET